MPPGPRLALPKEPGKASLCLLLLLPEMYVVLDLPSLYGYASSPETAASNAVISFLSSIAKENREPLLQIPPIRPHYCSCQSMAKMFTYKNKGCIYCLGIAEPHCGATRSLWIASGPCVCLVLLRVLICRALVYHSLTCLNISQQQHSQTECCSWGPYGMKVWALSNLCHRFLVLALHVLKGVSRRCEYKWWNLKDDGL